MLDALKLLALLAMTLDHVDVVVYDRSQDWLMLIGRIAFPCFAVAAGFGAVRTRAPRHYLGRLLACALVSQPFFVFAGGLAWWQLNTVFTLLCGVAAALAWRFGRPGLIPLALLPSATADYGPLGAAAVLASAMILGGPPRLRAAVILISLLLSPLLWPDGRQLAVALPAAGLALWLWSRHGAAGRAVGARYVFYFYYPLHLAALVAYDALRGL